MSKKNPFGKLVFQKEIAYFRAQGKPIIYIEPNDFILGKSNEMLAELPKVTHQEIPQPSSAIVSSRK